MCLQILWITTKKIRTYKLRQALCTLDNVYQKLPQCSGDAHTQQVVRGERSLRVSAQPLMLPPHFLIPRSPYRPRASALAWHTIGTNIKNPPKIRLKSSWNYISFTLKYAGGDGFNPSIGRLPAISHRIILWSQKLLTLTLHIPTRK